MKKPERIQLKTITPTTVGSGKVLSAYTDFFIADSEAVYVDHQKVRDRLKQLLPGNPAIISAYMDKISGNMDASNMRSKANLGEFLEQHLGLTLEDFNEKYAFEGEKPDDEKIQIQQIIRNAGSPYLPGSSIKGAFVTALLFDWLLNMPNGKAALNNIMQDIENTYSIHSEAIELREKMFAEDRKKTNNYYEKELLWKLKNGIKEIESRIDKQFEPLFGRMSKEKPMEFSALRVGDSALFDKNDLIINTVKRFNLKDGTFGIPQMRECLKANLEGSFSLQVIQNGASFTEVPGLKQSEPLETLFKSVNRFSLETIQHDLIQFKNYVNREPNHNHKLQGLLDFFSEQIEFLEATPANTCRLRLGAGKSYFNNSIGLAILKCNPDTFKYWIALVALGKPMQKQFPITRVLTDPDFIPIGWIELSYQK